MKIDTGDEHKKTPFLRIAICYIIGIVLDENVKISLFFWAISIIIFLSLLSFISISKPTFQWKYKTHRGIFLCMSILCFGGLCNHLRSFNKNVPELTNENSFVFKIENDVKKTKTGIRQLAYVYDVKDERCIFITKGYLYINTKNIHPFNIGDIVITNSKTERIKNYNNPGEYDFAYQAALKGIFTATHISDSTSFIKIGNEKNLFKTSILNIRNWIIQTLDFSLKDKLVAGLAEAMMIGYKDELDKDLLKSYINTGVVHIIAISGLHLGLIFIIIDFLIRLFLGKKRTDKVGLLITIPILWGFSILTGGSASVIRSALMLSVILISKTINKKSTGMNSLLASALILLINEPTIIYDIGFQLSYSAVASILIFDPIIKKMIYVKNPIAKKCWEMISITLSAQILTTPLTLFYFHQFPTLFLFTNLVAVPLSSLILITEIILCFVFFIGLPIKIPAALTTQLIHCLNSYIQKIEQIPFGMIKYIYIGVPTMCALYLFVFLLLRLKTNSTPNRILWVLISICAISMIQFSDMMIRARKSRIVILNIPGQTCVLIQKGSNSVVIGSEKLFKDSKFKTIFDQLRATYWIREFKLRSFPTNQYQINIDLQLISKDISDKKKYIVLFAGTPKIEINQINIPFEAIKIVIGDHSNKLWKIRQWEKESDRLLLRFHSVAEAGPFILECNQ